MYSFTNSGKEILNATAMITGVTLTSEGFSVNHNIKSVDFYVVYTKAAETNVLVEIRQWLPVANNWFTVSGVNFYGTTAVLEKGFLLDPASVVGASDRYLLRVPDLPEGNYTLNVTPSGAVAGCSVRIVVKMEET